MRRLGGLLVLAFVASAGSALAGPTDDTVRLAYYNPLRTTDSYVEGQQETAATSRAVFDGLVGWDWAAQKPIPLLARSWTQHDAQRWTFELRDDVKFHDGSKLTAEDVVHTLRFAGDPKSGLPFSARFSWIESVEAMGPLSVTIRAKRPEPLALMQLAFGMPIYPKAAHGAGDPKTFGQKPVGTGPYRVESFDVGKQLVLVRNERYFANDAKPPAAVGRVVVRHVPEVQTQVAELLAGGLDLVHGVPADQAATLARNPRVKVDQADTNYFLYMVFDAAGRSGADAMKDLRVRRALSHAVNRDALIKALLPGGTARRIDAFCHPGWIGCTQDVLSYAYDPAQARALLAEAGATGLQTELSTFRADYRTYAQAILGDWRAAGVEARLDFAALPAFRKRQDEGALKSYVVAWGAGGQPNIAFTLLSHFGGRGMDMTRDEALTRAVEAAASETDPVRAAALYRDVLRTIADKAYALPIATLPTVDGHAPDLVIGRDSLDAVPSFYRLGWRRGAAR